MSSPRASFAPVIHNLLHAKPPSREFQTYPRGRSISACARDTVKWPTHGYIQPDQHHSKASYIKILVVEYVTRLSPWITYIGDGWRAIFQQSSFQLNATSDDYDTLIVAHETDTPYGSATIETALVTTANKVRVHRIGWVFWKPDLSTLWLSPHPYFLYTYFKPSPSLAGSANASPPSELLLPALLFSHSLITWNYCDFMFVCFMTDQKKLSLAHNSISALGHRLHPERW